MIAVIAISMSYLWNDFLYVYFFRRVFKEKYSKKTTFWATILLWAIQFFTKILPCFILGLEVAMYLSVLMLMFHVIHLYCLFDGSIVKRAVAMAISTIVQGIMDYLGLNLTSRIVGNYDLLKPDSNFTLVAVGVSATLITVGMVFLTKSWQILKSDDWKMSQKEWTCVILPVSQIFWVWHMIIVYSVNYQSIPLVMMWGSILAVVTDIYMLWLFVRLNKKNEAEKQLKALMHQYELEQIRYEQLKERQEDIAKIRHDFQNYVITLRQMAKTIE